MILNLLLFLLLLLLLLLLPQAEREASLRVAELQSSLECCQADASSLREQLQQLEQQQQQQQQQQRLSIGRQGSTPIARRGGTPSLASQGTASSQQLLQANQQQHQGSPFLHSSGSQGSTGLVHMSSTGSVVAVGSPNAWGNGAQKWQAQNKVGGGSLYGVADSAVEAAAHLPVGSCSQRDVVSCCFCNNRVDLM
jgi:TolA-binding protein